MRNQVIIGILAGVILFVISGLLIAATVPSPVGAPDTVDGDDVAQDEVAFHAVAVVHPTEGNQVSGVVRFYTADDGVHITAELSGLTPGDHGFHIHQFGDCSAPNGSAAGGHFNPAGVAHGGPESGIRHLGDLGNITADAEGNARHQRVDPHLSLVGANAIIGHGIIVHADADDYTSQPTGAAGGRVGCGVIGRSALPGH